MEKEKQLLASLLAYNNIPFGDYKNYITTDKAIDLFVQSTPMLEIDKMFLSAGLPEPKDEYEASKVFINIYNKISTIDETSFSGTYKQEKEKEQLDNILSSLQDNQFPIETGDNEDMETSNDKGSFSSILNQIENDLASGKGKGDGQGSEKSDGNGQDGNGQGSEKIDGDGQDGDGQGSKKSDGNGQDSKQGDSGGQDGGGQDGGGQGSEKGDGDGQDSDGDGGGQDGDGQDGDGQDGGGQGSEKGDGDGQDGDGEQNDGDSQEGEKAESDGQESEKAESDGQDSDGQGGKQADSDGEESDGEQNDSDGQGGEEGDSDKQDQQNQQQQKQKDQQKDQQKQQQRENDLEREIKLCGEAIADRQVVLDAIEANPNKDESDLIVVEDFNKQINDLKNQIDRMMDALVSPEVLQINKQEQYELPLYVYQSINEKIVGLKAEIDRKSNDILNPYLNEIQDKKRRNKLIIDVVLTNLKYYSYNKLNNENKLLDLYLTKKDLKELLVLYTEDKKVERIILNTNIAGADELIIKNETKINLLVYQLNVLEKNIESLNKLKNIDLIFNEIKKELLNKFII